MKRENYGKGMGRHHSAAMGKDEWLTPPDMIRALGPFDLDPCAPIVRPWPTAARHFTVEDDGLSKVWEGRVWLNPPYGSFTGEWLEKLSQHGNGLALVFARTETKTWHTHVWPRAHAILFLAGRINFHHVSGERADKNCGAPLALIAYGYENAAALRSAGVAGHFVLLTPTADRHQPVFKL